MRGSFGRIKLDTGCMLKSGYSKQFKLINYKNKSCIGLMHCTEVSRRRIIARRGRINDVFLKISFWGTKRTADTEAYRKESYQKILIPTEH